MKNGKKLQKIILGCVLSAAVVFSMTGCGAGQTDAGSASGSDSNSENSSGMEDAVGTAGNTAKDNGNYLTFTAEKDGSVISLSWISGDDVQVKASSSDVVIDGNSATADWETYTDDAEIKLSKKGDSVSFKASNLQTTSSSHFSMDGEISASGDVTSLTNGAGGNTALQDDCYRFMFYGCQCLTSAPALPSTTVAEGCYAGMFNGCIGLTQAPALPATTMQKECYTEMFRDCTGLKTIPELPATTLAQGCYYMMFFGCSSLDLSETKDDSHTLAWGIPKGAATSAKESKLWSLSMFSGCNNVAFSSGEIEVGKTYYQKSE